MVFPSTVRHGCQRCTRRDALRTADNNNSMPVVDTISVRDEVEQLGRSKSTASSLYLHNAIAIMDWLPHHSYRDCFLQLHKVHKLRSRTGSVMGLLILEDLNDSSSCLWVCMLQGSCKGLIKHQPGVIMSVHPLMQHIALRVLRVRGCLHKIPFNIVIQAIALDDDRDFRS
ncbi:unnamed protein product [Sphagnum tenellum]